MAEYGFNTKVYTYNQPKLHFFFKVASFYYLDVYYYNAMVAIMGFVVHLGLLNVYSLLKMFVISILYHHVRFQVISRICKRRLSLCNDFAEIWSPSLFMSLYR